MRRSMSGWASRSRHTQDSSQRTATAGVTSLARSTGHMLGPALAAAFLIPVGIGVPLIASGVLKIAYDISLYTLFRSRPTPEEAAATTLSGA